MPSPPQGPKLSSVSLFLHNKAKIIKVRGFLHLCIRLNQDIILQIKITVSYRQGKALKNAYQVSSKVHYLECFMSLKSVTELDAPISLSLFISIGFYAVLRGIQLTLPRYYLKDFKPRQGKQVGHVVLGKRKRACNPPNPTKVTFLQRQ